MKAEIRLRKLTQGYFKTKEERTVDQWKEHIEKAARRTLAKNGWEVEEVKVEA